MRLFKYHKDLSQYLASFRQRSVPIGFVPTMGALHEGHLSLLEEARSRGCMSVVSIFVNPTQFNDPADFDKYPKTLDSDLLLLERQGCEVLYLPDVPDIYPQGPALTKAPELDLQGLDQRLEGAFRPGHFGGVVQVMERLLQLVQPQMLFMGLKDYQQVLVVRRLLEARKFPVELVGMETRREPDGLAMSSRNLRLSGQARSLAPLLHATLQEILQSIRRAPEALPEWLQEGRRKLESSGFRVEYLELARADNLQALEAPLEAPGRLLCAAWLDKVRLIDNLALEPRAHMRP